MIWEWKGITYPMNIPPTLWLVIEPSLQFTKKLTMLPSHTGASYRNLSSEYLLC